MSCLLFCWYFLCCRFSQLFYPFSWKRAWHVEWVLGEWIGLNKLLLIASGMLTQCLLINSQLCDLHVTSPYNILHYPANKKWEYTNLSGKSDFDLTPNSCFLFMRKPKLKSRVCLTNQKASHPPLRGSTKEPVTYFSAQIPGLAYLHKTMTVHCCWPFGNLLKSKVKKLL